MGHQTQKSIAGMGLFYRPLLSPPPPPPPPPFHGDSPFSIAKGEWYERRVPSEEHEGIEALNRRLGAEEESERSNGRRVHEDKQPKSSGRGHWRPSEDAKLKELVSQYGPHNWNLIAEKLEGRSGKSCRLRWFNQLDPRINRRAFSVEEDEKLLAFHRVYGNKWSLIARFFPGRTDNAVKNQWHVIMARKKREQCSRYMRRKAFTTSPDHWTQALPQMMNMSSGHNAWSGDSSITSTRDESTSTCTGLPLTPSACRFMPCFLKDSGLASHQQAFHFFLGLDEKLQTRRNGCNEKPGEPGTVFNNGSATEPAANHTNNAFLQAERDGGTNKISSRFIDFLGIGAA